MKEVKTWHSSYVEKSNAYNLCADMSDKIKSIFMSKSELLPIEYVKNRILILWYYTIGIIGIGGEDVVLTSFPKSGNTWVRFFLCNLISLQEWDGQTVTFTRLDATMPELGRSNLLRNWHYEVIPRVVKTHKPYWPVFDGMRTILLTRDPRDVMVSYYHFEKGKRDGRFDGSFSAFLRHSKFGIRPWCEHLRAWRGNADVVLTYERLKQNDVREFNRMLNAIEVPLPQSLVQQAAERSRFQEIQKIESESGVRREESYFKEGKKFTRKGETGQWEEYFDTTDLKYVSDVMSEYDIEMYNI